MRRRLSWLALGLLGASVASRAVDAPVAEALQRPAQQVSAPTRAVMIDIVQAGERLVAVGEQGLIVLSDDSGRQWRQVPVPTSMSLTASSFPTPRQGWVIGHGGIVLHTADGGDSWTVQLDGKAAARYVLDAAASVADGSVARQRQLRIAQGLVADGADKPWLAVYFSNEREGTLVGAFGLMLHTVDGGVTWQSWMDRLDNPAGNHLYGIVGQGQQIYIAGEQGALWASQDGGAHFRRLPSPYQGSFFTLNLAPNGEVLVAGLKGNVWRSSDLGQHWQALKNSFTSSIVAARSVKGGEVMLADQSGHLLLVASGGELREQRPLAGPALSALSQAPDGQWVVVGARGIERLEQVNEQ
jgi:photosystem II stability/assembly factor-like uncharacterized protein